MENKIGIDEYLQQTELMNWKYSYRYTGKKRKMHPLEIAKCKIEIDMFTFDIYCQIFHKPEIHIKVYYLNTWTERNVCIDQMYLNYSFMSNKLIMDIVKEWIIEFKESVAETRINID